MTIDFNPIGRAAPTPRPFPTDGDVRPGGVSDSRSAAGVSGDWKVTRGGVDRLGGVYGEELVDESALRRDDALGKLAEKAFDASVAAASLPPLGLSTTEGNA